MRELGWADEDVDALGRFLRQINVGRSVDCLPQGIHPAKVLGAEFLRFLDNSSRLRSSEILRFQDDIHIFDDDAERVTADLVTLQALLGEKGLSLNASKTHFGPQEVTTDIEEEVEGMLGELLQKRRDLIASHYEEDPEAADDVVEEEEEEYDPLTEDQIRYLLGLITSSDVEESDAELVLALLRDHGEEVLPHMVDILGRFPGLSKNVYNYVRFAPNLEDVDDLILTFLGESPHVTEFQLFWLTKLATDFLNSSPRIGEILTAAYEHPNATVVTQSKILEHPDNRFGLTELREEQLRSGQSGWLAWSAAAGSRALKPGSRNHLLSYFAHASSFNAFMAECIKKLPETKLTP